MADIFACRASLRGRVMFIVLFVNVDDKSDQG